MTQEELILDEFGWHLAIEEDRLQFSNYWTEYTRLDALNIIFGRISVHHEPPDTGWRVYLGMVLRRIQDKSLRIKELEDFYHYWREMISK